MIVGEFVALRTVDSQKTAKPANRRLNGTINQSLLVSRSSLGGLSPPDNFLALQEETLERVGLHVTFAPKKSPIPSAEACSTRAQTQCMNLPCLQPHDWCSDRAKDSKIFGWRTNVSGATITIHE
jgi:hypothetical protein